MRFITPLRYPGGKAKLFPFFKELLVQNDLIGCRYVEPYAGGAGLALHLLLNHFVSNIHLNDISKPVYALWQSILNSTEELCKKINDTPVDMEQWAVQKNKLSSPPDATLLDLGFAALFLNRTNRSGILSGGVIGGKKQSGTWRMDARFNKKALIQRIKTIANLKDNIHVTNSDALYFLDSFASTLQCSRTIIFLDPPYFTQGKRLYQNFYQIEDHSQIAIYVQNKITSPWVVTYDNAPEILSLYSNRNLIQYKLSYCASKKYQGAEVMFLADSLILPQKAPYIPGKYSPRKLETASLPI